MNWRRIVCWLWSHSWEVVEGKRHCTACDYRPKDDNVIFCPKCGSEDIMGHIMASAGYQYRSCLKCGHKFQSTGAGVVTVAFGDDCYELDRPMIDQDGKPIEQEIEE